MMAKSYITTHEKPRKDHYIERKEQKRSNPQKIRIVTRSIESLYNHLTNSLLEISLCLRKGHINQHIYVRFRVQTSPLYFPRFNK